MTYNFVLSKSRLTPIEQSSIDILKLELQAAVPAVQLKSYGKNQSRSKQNIPLVWFQDIYICNEHSKFSVYVEHRINEIQENSSISQWQYIPSKM